MIVADCRAPLKVFGKKRKSLFSPFSLTKKYTTRLWNAEPFKRNWHQSRAKPQEKRKPTLMIKTKISLVEKEKN